MPLLDIATSQTSFGSRIYSSRAQLLVHGSAQRKVIFRKEKKLSSTWKVSMPRKINFSARHTNMRDTLMIKAVYTLEQKHSTQNEDGEDDDHRFLFDPESNLKIFQSSIETSSEVDENEKLRRLRISIANKGNVPWNKGRKHSAETLRRIRERTKIAMQDPKVKMKLVNLGHAQTEETRMKIGIGVRMGWQRRREKLMLQETCCFEWQNLVAEASRRGYSGEEELQWDSYKILDKQLEQEWLESIEQRKSTPRPKGNKRAPKSPEQRRKISEAISAKWNDPGYRERVCSALEKYHGTPIGSRKRPPRRKSSGNSDSEKSPVKRKAKDFYNDFGLERKSQVRSKSTRSAPKYKDPLADSKLEMIKNIRAQRMAMENKKIEAMERARLLITEAEKASKSLEEAALTSRLARASLIETRKLIAEATRSIEAAETGHITSHEKDGHSSSNLNVRVNHYGEESDSRHTDHMPPSIKKVNGIRVPFPGDNGIKDLDFGNITVQDQINDRQHEGARTDGQSSYPSWFNSLISRIGPEEQQLETNEAIKNGGAEMQNDEKTDQSRMEASEISGATNPIKKWIRGRLVEVSEPVLELGETVDQEQ